MLFSLYFFFAYFFFIEKFQNFPKNMNRNIFEGYDFKNETKDQHKLVFISINKAKSTNINSPWIDKESEKFFVLFDVDPDIW